MAPAAKAPKRVWTRQEVADLARQDGKFVYMFKGERRRRSPLVLRRGRVPALTPSLLHSLPRPPTRAGGVYDVNADEIMHPGGREVRVRSGAGAANRRLLLPAVARRTWPTRLAGAAAPPSPSCRSCWRSTGGRTSQRHSRAAAPWATCTAR